MWENIEPEIAALEQYENEGVERVLYRIPSETADRALPRLDELAGILKR